MGGSRGPRWKSAVGISVAVSQSGGSWVSLSLPHVTTDVREAVDRLSASGRAAGSPASVRSRSCGQEEDVGGGVGGEQL